MKKLFLLLPLILLLTSLGFARKAKATARPAQADGLQDVLARMNKAAANFKTGQADFEWLVYTKVVEQTDIQKGKIYYRRKGAELSLAIKIESPVPKQIVVEKGTLLMYEKRIDQLTERKLGKNKDDIEAGMSLGFGSRGDDLTKNYEVQLAGWETVDGVKTAKLELVPKRATEKQYFTKIIMWIDPDRDVALKQQFFQPSEDYRLVHNTNIQVNSKIPADVFQLPVTGSTKRVKA
jgi:outer membrane lipoprotein-sorting protein